jgi:hypothetical protein
MIPLCDEEEWEKCKNKNSYKCDNCTRNFDNWEEYRDNFDELDDVSVCVDLKKGEIE